MPFVLQEQLADAQSVVHASLAVAEEAGAHQNQQWVQLQDSPVVVVVGQPSGSNPLKKGEAFTSWAINDLNAASQTQQHCVDQT